MASFPATIKSFITKINGGVIDSSHINDLQDEVTALESNVGTTNSAVATTIDYQLKNASSVNPGHKHTLTGALTDVEITSPTNGQGLVYESASGKFKNQTTAIADATTAVKGINLMSVAPVSAASPIAVGDNDPRVPTQNENNALVGTSGTAVSSSNKLVDNADTATSGANKVLRLDGTGKLPALDGSQLTNIGSIPLCGTVATSSSGTQNIAHGLGATPKYIRITGQGTDGLSHGFYNGTTKTCVYKNAGNNTGVTTSYIANISSSGNQTIYSTAVPTVDSTNIVLTWTAVNGGSTGTISWEAYK